MLRLLYVVILYYKPLLIYLIINNIQAKLCKRERKLSHILKYDTIVTILTTSGNMYVALLSCHPNCLYMEFCCIFSSDFCKL